jgi:hypothetical protein
MFLGYPQTKPDRHLRGMPETTRENQGKRWRPGQSGNPAGRPRGARHAALLALDAIGAEAGKEIMTAVVAAAKAGDMRAADILLRRLWPERKGRPVMLELPAMKSASDLPVVLSAITEAVAAGDLTPEEGQALAGVVEVQRRAIETVELEARITTLEQREEQRR